MSKSVWYLGVTDDISTDKRNKTPSTLGLLFQTAKPGDGTMMLCGCFGVKLSRKEEKYIEKCKKWSR